MKLTPSSFNALAQLIRLRSGPASLAAGLVLTEDMRPADAARVVDCAPQSVHNTLAACRRGVDLARQVVDGLEEKDPSDKSD